MPQDNRRKPRKGCRMPASIRTGANEQRAYIVDFSHLGVRLLVENAARTISEDQEIEIHTKEFGLLKGKARWRSSHRVGVELLHSEDTLARIGAVWEGDAESSAFDRIVTASELADALLRAARQPDLLTKDEIAELMVRAAEKIRGDEQALTGIRNFLSACSIAPEDRLAGRSS